MKSKEILDEQAMKRSLTRITYEIIEHNKGVYDIILVGIKTRGEILAYRLQEMILQIEGIEVACTGLDIRPWRDDVAGNKEIPKTFISVQNKKVILVDDVLFHGRSVRAAMDAIMYYGRAEEIQLAVLVDRGHRELPIHPNYIGKNIPSSLDEKICVNVKEIDDRDGVFIEKQED